MSLKENNIEQKLIEKLEELKYTYRPDIRDKVTLEQNFREKFESLNHVYLVPTLPRGNAYGVTPWVEAVTK